MSDKPPIEFGRIVVSSNTRLVPRPDTDLQEIQATKVEGKPKLFPVLISAPIHGVVYLGKLLSKLGKGKRAEVDVSYQVEGGKAVIRTIIPKEAPGSDR